MKPKTLDMEILVSQYYNPRQNLIVPNLSWGMFSYEHDLCILSKNGYATEVEIKTSKADLIKDKEKGHDHNNKMMKYLFFAIPEHLLPDTEHIPERAGIFVVSWNKPMPYPYHKSLANGWWSCRRERQARAWQNYKWSDSERQDLLRLAAMRTWTLKKQLQKERKKNAEHKVQGDKGTEKNTSKA